MWYIPLQDKVNGLDNQLGSFLAFKLCELANSWTWFCLVRFPQPIHGVNNGRSYIQGHIEIYYQGEWGTICDDHIDSSDHGATVLCRMMGLYDGDESDSYRQSDVTPSSRIWLDDVQCTGTETSIIECSHRLPWGSHNCGHSEDVAIRCYSTYFV